MGEWVQLKVVLRVTSRRLQHWSERLSALAGDDKSIETDGRPSARERWLEHIRQIAPDYAEQVRREESVLDHWRAPPQPEADASDESPRAHPEPEPTEPDDAAPRPIRSRETRDVAGLTTDSRDSGAAPVLKPLPDVPEAPRRDQRVRSAAHRHEARDEPLSDVAETAERDRVEPDRRLDDGSALEPTPVPERREPPAPAARQKEPPRDRDAPARPGRPRRARRSAPLEPIRATSLEPEPVAGRLRFVRRRPRPQVETMPARRMPVPSVKTDPHPHHADPSAETRAPRPVVLWSSERRAPVATAPSAPPPVADDPWPELPERSAPAPEDVSRALRVFERTLVLRDEQIGTRWSA